MMIYNNKIVFDFVKHYEGVFGFVYVLGFANLEY